MSKHRFRFDLFAIIEWTAVIAFLCALLAGGHRKESLTYEFSRLPREDSVLLHWLTEQGYRNVAVHREDDSITLETVTFIFGRSDSLPSPPWQELGYSAPVVSGGTFVYTVFSASGYLWLTGFAILIALGQYRRRYIKPRSTTSTTGSGACDPKVSPS